MKKWSKSKKILVMLPVISVLLLVVFLLCTWLLSDTEAPVITCPESVLKADVAITEEELLQGVTAQDNRDGDLSDSIVVEQLSALGKKNTRRVTYAVMDLSGNVGRATRTIRYKNYEKPRIRLKAPLRVSGLEQLETPLQWIEADSVLDGDLTTKVKYNFLNNTSLAGKGTYKIEYRVNDSAGSSTIIPTVLEIYDAQEEPIQLELREYITYLSKGDTFSPKSYYEGASEWGELSIDSNVDMSEPGVYHVEYLLQGAEGRIGRTRLIVVVED